MLESMGTAIIRYLVAAVVLSCLGGGTLAQAGRDSAPCAATIRGPASASLARAMEIPARDIDAELPAVCISDWLSTALDIKASEWGLSNCDKPADGKQVENKVDLDAPQCLLAYGSSSTLQLRVKIFVGTVAKPVSGKPLLRSAIVSGCGQTKTVAALRNLEKMIKAVSAACTK